MNSNITYLFKLVFITLAIFLPATTLSAKGNEFTIVIDPGHGGHDHGAIDNGTTEKAINLGVALKVGELVKKNLKNSKLVYTRSDDTFKTLQERADIANKAKGDLFISIHTNSVDKSNKNRTNVSGASVYALGLHKDANNMNVARRENSVIELENNHDTKYQGFDPNKDESYIIFEMAQKKNLSKSIRFANDVQKQLVKVASRKDRGVHQAGFWVLWATSMPAVLIELDFICNPVSAQYLASEDGQSKLAEAIFNAIKEYYSKEHTESTVAPSPQQKKREIESEKKRISMKELQASADNELPKKMETENYDNEPVNPVLLSSTESQPVRHRVRETSSNKPVNTQRRRRSESAKLASDSKVIETGNIPLHHDNERLGEPMRSAENLNVKTGNISNNSKENKDKKSQIVKNKDKRKGKIQHLKTNYCIQILASSEKLRQDNPRFQGLKPISMIHENNLYKYTYGESADKKEIEKKLVEVKKLFPDAFILETKK